MRDGKVCVEGLADAVTDERSHHTEACALGMILDGATDRIDGLTRADLSNGQFETFTGDANESLRLGVHRTDEERCIGVAVHPLAKAGDIEVDDVTVSQRPIVGDSVTDDLVDRGAQRLLVTVVVERAGVGASLERDPVAEFVELIGGHAGGDRGTHLGQHVAG